jgi:ribonuclease P protein component
VETDRLFKEGKRISGKYCTLIWEVGDSSKFGVFLSKGHRKAADRNRIKRLYREAIRLNRHLIPRLVNIGVLPNAKVKQPAFAEINAEISRIFKLIQAKAQ